VEKGESNVVNTSRIPSINKVKNMKPVRDEIKKPRRFVMSQSRIHDVIEEEMVPDESQSSRRLNDRGMYSPNPLSDDRMYM